MADKHVLAEIDRLRAKLEALIEDHVAREVAQNPSVPPQMVRQLASQNSGCLCSVVSHLLQRKDAA
jgi:hypothetical protein